MSGPVSSDVGVRMDRMYRHQRFIYDLTRKYYLIGRDRALRELSPAPGGAVVEIGCGTGRNLVLAARMWPQLRFVGVDASNEMLRSAAGKIEGNALHERVRLVHGFAERVDARTDLRIADGAGCVLFSYALSMIDDPIGALERARWNLAAGGRIVVVDFGDMRAMPGFAAKGLRAWLERFGVRHKPEVSRWMERQDGATRTTFLGGYAELLTARPA